MCSKILVGAPERIKNRVKLRTSHFEKTTDLHDLLDLTCDGDHSLFTGRLNTSLLCIEVEDT